MGRRMVKKQQMRWTRWNAHLLLQVRYQTLNNKLRDTYGRRYLGMATTSAEELPLAA
jgi:hypothetical protein